MRRNTRQCMSPQALDSATDIEFKLNKDSYGILKVLIMVYGYVALTITSGAVVCKAGSFCQNIFKNISVTQGGTIYKSATPSMMRFTEGVITGKFPALRATAGATASSVGGMTDIVGGGTIPVGTTGQYQNLYEELSFHFEMIYSDVESVRRSTALRTKDKGDTLLTFQQQSFSNLLGVGNTSVISYGSLSNMYISVEIEELVEEIAGEGNLAKNIPTKAFYELEQTKTIRASMNNDRLDGFLGYGGEILGYYFKAQDNAAGSAATASGKLNNDLLITKMEMLVDNKLSLFQSSWKQLKRALNVKFKYPNALTTLLSEDTGFSGVCFVGESMEGIPKIAAGANIELVLSTAAQATATDYGASDKAFLTSVVHFIADV